MPCYSYLSGPSILLNSNVEVVLTATAGQTNFSYSSLYWVCDFPIESQLEVFTRPSPAGPETQLIYLTNYTISGTNVVLGTPPTAGYQVVIRRKTQDARMLVRFNDGAKLTSKDLNDNFHQLLFLLQEKQLSEANIYHQYTISTAVQPWNSGTAYVANDIVLLGNALYRCILGHTNFTPPNATYWALITATANSGFVFTNAPSNPIVINLTALSIGDALTWDGSEFIAAPLAATLNDLTDVTIASANTGDLLIYNGTAWVDQAPSFDITQNNIKFANRAFYANLGNDNSYTSSGGTVAAPGALSVFKRTTPEPGWVLTDPPTVYHILQKTIPSETDPITFFSNIQSQLNSLAANVGNPIKAKLEWRLHNQTLNKVDTNTNDLLNGYKSIFWDNPNELYNAAGYNLAAPSPLHMHGVLVNSESKIYQVNPYFRRELNSSPVAQTSFTSNLSGYGIKAFYLSVPESCSTNLKGISIVNPANPSLFLSYTANVQPTFLSDINKLGGKDQANYRDLYLLNLRDMAHAAIRDIPGDDAGNKNSDAVARLLKGIVICAAYNGLEDINYKRLESNDTPFNVFWKIPKQMIYYNKVALALTNKSTVTQLTTGSSLTDFNTKDTRFQGHHKLAGNTFNTTYSTTSSATKGSRFKADEYWSDWMTKWAQDAATNENYRFNEADIEWALYGITKNVIDNNGSIGLFSAYGNMPTRTILTNATGWDNNNVFGSSQNLYPWSFRPNKITRSSGSNSSIYDNLIGTHVTNFDANTLFSEASNFVPDPMDEYVFRVVCKKGLTGFFKDQNSHKLKSSIILEWGINEHFNSSGSSSVSSIEQIYQSMYAWTQDAQIPYYRLDRSKIKVYVKKEQIEQIGADERYVVTLGVLVPRLKSIGYSKVFRKFTNNFSVSADYPSQTPGTADSDTDSGPWDFRLDSLNDITTTGVSFSSGGTGGTANIENNNTNRSNAFTIEFVENGFALDTLVGDIEAKNPNHPKRNECAVKFTRIGLPSTLWIRVSILNTDPTLPLIDSAGFTSATNE